MVVYASDTAPLILAALRHPRMDVLGLKHGKMCLFAEECSKNEALKPNFSLWNFNLQIVGWMYRGYELVFIQTVS